MKTPFCKSCLREGHYKTFCPFTRRKPINKRSTKQEQYDTWLESVARPFLIQRDGNYCICCKRAAKVGEKLDIEHTLTKGSRPDLKRDLNNLTLMCRFPCHRSKTDAKPCFH